MVATRWRRARGQRGERRRTNLGGAQVEVDLRGAGRVRAGVAYGGVLVIESVSTGVRRRPRRAGDGSGPGRARHRSLEFRGLAGASARVRCEPKLHVRDPRADGMVTVLLEAGVEGVLRRGDQAGEAGRTLLTAEDLDGLGA